MFKIVKIDGVKKIAKEEQKTIKGGRVPILQPSCYHSSDPECCGTASWQCGVGPHSGGRYRNGFCYCF